jgi:hypothetical protein
VTASQA